MSSVLYRSPELRDGAFRRLGGLHVHIDGDLSLERLTALVKIMETQGRPGKVTAVSDFVAGTQRVTLPETYASHTPGTTSEERFKYFSTISLASREDAIAVLKALLPAISEFTGSVVEIEQVVAASDGGNLQLLRSRSVNPIERSEVGFRPSPTAPYEIHHGVNCESRSEDTVTLQTLDRDLTLEGLSVGGWFTFEKNNRTSYRSSSFVTAENFECEALQQRQLLKRYFESKGHPFELWTTVERVIGIWKAPFDLV